MDSLVLLTDLGHFARTAVREMTILVYFDDYGDISFWYDVHHIGSATRDAFARALGRRRERFIQRIRLESDISNDHISEYFFYSRRRRFIALDTELRRQSSTPA